MDSQERTLRQEMVRIGRLAYERGFFSGFEGNLSARLDSDRFLITPSGVHKGSSVHKGMLEPQQLLLVDGAGRPVGPTTAAYRALKPTSELPMHLEVYRQRPDVAAVVHAHPTAAIALSIAGISFADYQIPEVIVLLGTIPIADYATPSSAETVDAIRELIEVHDAIVLRWHGSLTVGASLMEAFMRLETVEQSARIAHKLAQLGCSAHLPRAEIRTLLQMREEMGLGQPGDVARLRKVYGVGDEAESHGR
jgi:L-fuculose-phosphate aldolase